MAQGNSSISNFTSILFLSDIELIGKALYVPITCKCRKYDLNCNFPNNFGPLLPKGISENHQY